MSQEIRIRPETPEAARAEIERTRERISETLDEIEVAILRKKERLQEQLDVRARIRERPMEAAGIVLGLGLLLGFLTGGGDRKARRNAEALSEAQRAADRASIWEARARRLLAIARGQEEEIDHLEAVLDATTLEHDDEWEDEDWEEDEWEEDEWEEEYEDGWEERPRRFRSVRASLGGRLSDLLTRGTEVALDAAERVRNRVRTLG